MSSTHKPQQKKVMLPRGYLSWSAFNTFKRNREEYIRHYFYGEPSRFNNASMDFGRSFAESLEKRHDKKRVEHADPVTEMILKSAPIKARTEHSMKALLPSRWGDIPLIGSLDQYDDQTHAFDEYKTGWRKWTQNMASNHGQMKFYSLMIWLNFNVVNQERNLIWVETEKEGGSIRPTGRIVKFPVVITMPQLLKFSREVVEVAHEISELYAETINKTVL